MAQVQLTIHNVFLADILLRKFAELDQLISGGLAGVFHYSGSVNSYDDLPEEGMKIGDTYNIVTANKEKNIAAGDNLAWNGTSWDNLRGIIDLSAYYTAAQCDSKFATKESLTAELAKKAEKTHTHAISDVTNLQTELNKKANTADLSSLAPLANPAFTGSATLGGKTIATTDQIPSNYLPTTGGTLTGALIVLAPTGDMNPATKQYVDQLIAGLRISNISGLQNALDQKQASGDYVTNTTYSAKVSEIEGRLNALEAPGS